MNQSLRLINILRDTRRLAIQKMNGNKLKVLIYHDVNHDPLNKYLISNRRIKESCTNTFCLQRQFMISNRCLLRGFHTTNKMYLSPVGWLFCKQAMEIMAIITGYYLRYSWRKMSPLTQLSFMEFIRSSLFTLLAGSAVITGLAVRYYTSHIQKTPLTGRTRFMVFTDDQVRDLAEAEADVLNRVFQKSYLESNHPHNIRVKRVLDTLLNSNMYFRSQVEITDWHVAVIESEIVNASVLPTGHVFVFGGVMSMIENDDQLSILLGHELSHVMLSHARERISHELISHSVFILPVIAIWAFLPTNKLAFIVYLSYNILVRLVMFSMPRTRMIEQEADEIGLQLCARACYDVREGSVFWRKMAARHLEIPEIFSTHPLSDRRAQYLDDITPKAIKIRDSCRCPPLPILDPRNSKTS